MSKKDDQGHPPDRPNCATCGGSIPLEALSEKDWGAEVWYCHYRYNVASSSRVRRRVPLVPRDFYCSTGCFRQARAEATSKALEPTQAYGTAT